ncbi:hypothetical protein [uncultured Oscillibacter sp.]|uniref:hypothetical protein n=1 Tax=uncultured Oscillibacter sp. TaxID=876091 RepID=UPI002804AF21|nr:hypothetical protein [uncultured Oscillibacter sp.]
MGQTVLKGFEILLMTPSEAVEHRGEAQTVGEANEMLLRVCEAARDTGIADGKFREMVLKLLDKRTDILEELMPLPRL